MWLEEYFDRMIAKRKDEWNDDSLYNFIMDCNKHPESPYNYRQLHFECSYSLTLEKLKEKIEAFLGELKTWEDKENFVMTKVYNHSQENKIKYLYEVFYFNPCQTEEMTARLREKYVKTETRK